MSNSPETPKKGDFFYEFTEYGAGDFPPPYVPVDARRGSRDIAKSNMGSHRPVTVINGNQAALESLGEFRVARILLARPETADVIEQQPMVRYVDANGIPRRHTFDLLWILKSGVRFAVQVKVKSSADRKATDDLMALIAAQMPSSQADYTLLMTDRDAPPRLALQADRILYALSRSDAGPNDKIFREKVLCQCGPLTMRQMRDVSGLGGRAPYAAERALGRGEIRRVDGPHGGLYYPVASEARP